MRSVSQTLLDAVANGSGDTIIRVHTWADLAAYEAAPSTPENTWECTSFDILPTSAKAEIITENDYTLSDFDVFIIERGVKVSGVEYVIQSGMYYVRKYTEDYGRIFIEGSSYPNMKISIAGDDTYQTVIEAFCAEIGKTAAFKNTGDAWLGYQFLPTGKTLSLNRAELIEGMLRQKYTILVYEGEPNVLTFYTQDSYDTFTFAAVHWSSAQSQLAAVASSGTRKIGISTDGEVWEPQTAPTNYNDIAYSPSLDLWVAVGASVAASSANGTTWTARTINAGTWNAVTWSDTLALFIAAGESANNITTSPDGITWTVRNSAAWAMQAAANAYNYYSVCWSPELSLFAAVGNSEAMTSPDGITWTSRPTANGISICWSSSLSLFVIVSAGGAIYTSPNGTTWTSQTPPTAGQTWISVCWSSSLSLFVAVGAGPTDYVMTSPDGTTWTARSASESNTWNSVTWSPELSLFVAVSGDGTNRVMTSPNGTAWTARSAAEANTWNSVTWSSELSLFVAVSSTGTNRVMTSSNGTAWTARSAAEANAWRSVCYATGLSLFVAVSSDGTNRVMTSSNGTTWTAEAAADAIQWYGITWSPELSTLCAVSSTGTGTSRVQIKRYQRFYEVTSSSAILCAVGMDCYTSINGTAWTSRTIPAGTYNGIGYGDSLFVAVGISKCATSSDAITWTSRTIPAGTYNAVIYSPTLALWVAVGASVCATSPDGTTWTARTITANTWQDIAWTGSLFVAVSSNGTSRAATSTDGINWILQSPEADFFLTYEDGPASNIVRDQSEVHYIWRDEAASVNTEGDTTKPQWNLGYLESTDSPPATRSDPFYKIYLMKAPVRLDITDSDKIHFTPYWSIDPSRTIDAMMQVSEHFKAGKSPAWYQEIKSIIMFNSTEGGQLPSTIERVAAYTPLVSTGFDGNLTPSVNNLQAFAQAVDDLPISMTTTERNAITPSRYLIIFNTTTSKLNFWDGAAWRVITST